MKSIAWAILLFALVIDGCVFQWLETVHGRKRSEAEKAFNGACIMLFFVFFLVSLV